MRLVFHSRSRPASFPSAHSGFTIRELSLGVSELPGPGQISSTVQRGVAHETLVPGSGCGQFCKPHYKWRGRMPAATVSSFDQIKMVQNVRFVCDVYGGCWRIEPRYPVMFRYYNDQAYAPTYSKAPAYVYGWGGPGVGMVRLRLSDGVPF